MSKVFVPCPQCGKEEAYEKIGTEIRCECECGKKWVVETDLEKFLADIGRAADCRE
jgi:hypothetical protein